MTRLAIRPHRPFRAFVVVLLAAVTAGASVFVIEERRVRVLSAQAEQAAGALSVTAERLAETMRENESLQTRLVVLERASQVDEESYREVDARLDGLARTILTLREEVAFYRGILSADHGRGVQVQSVLVDRPGEDRNAYRYQVVLTRQLKSDKVATGSVSLSIEGERAGDTVRLSFQEIAASDAPGLGFNFKHFQRLEGRLKLPADFVPQRIHVQVDAPGQRPASSVQRFDWPRHLYGAVRDTRRFG